MKVIQFDGTPEEFKAVAHLFSKGELVNGSRSPSGTAPTIDPKSAIKKVLSRRPISEGQRALYEALADGPVEYQELLRKTGREASVMAGVLGALGRRVSNTKEIRLAGLPENSEAILHWEYDGESYVYSLRDYALEALVEEGVIPG
jgi:hypothetical protein